MQPWSFTVVGTQFIVVPRAFSFLLVIILKWLKGDQTTQETTATMLECNEISSVTSASDTSLLTLSAAVMSSPSFILSQ